MKKPNPQIALMDQARKIASNRNLILTINQQNKQVNGTVFKDGLMLMEFSGIPTLVFYKLYSGDTIVRTGLVSLPGAVSMCA